MRCGNSDDRRIGRLIPLAVARLGTLAGSGLAQDIENVVGDLKSQTKRFAEARDALQLRRLGARHLRPQAQRSADQRAGFAHVNILDHADIDVAPLGLKIESLAADEPGNANGSEKAHGST